MKKKKKITKKELKKMWEKSNFIPKGDNNCEPKTIGGNVIFVDKKLEVIDNFFKRNLKAIKGAFKLLRNKKYVKKNLNW